MKKVNKMVMFSNRTKGNWIPAVSTKQNTIISNSRNTSSGNRRTWCSIESHQGRVQILKLGGKWIYFTREQYNTA